MLTRHAIQVLRHAGHDQADVARLIGVGVRTVRRVEGEPDVTRIDDATERAQRAIGRPAKAEPYRSVIAEILAQEPYLLSVEILRRVKVKGYDGGKTAL
jgi:transposase